MINTGGLVSLPLNRAGLLWPVYLGLIVVALVIGGRWWRSTPVIGFAVAWAVLGAWMPYALRVAPDAPLATREADAFGICAVLTLALVVVGRRARLHWWRIGWLGALLFAGGLAVWELVTGHHLWVTPENPFPFRGRIAVATYGNPNNFGIVLLSMLVALLAWRAVARTAGVRAVLVGLSVLAGALVLSSQSRAAVLGLLLVLGLEGARHSAAHPGWLKRAISRRPRVVFGAVATAVLAVASTFVVPALAARNPVLRMIRDAMLEETGRSDMLRLNLIRVSLRYLRESGYLGTGAGSFEPILWNDPTSGIEGEVNLHNAFFELLSQYGVVVAGALALLMGYVVWLWWRTRLSASVRPHVAAVRTEMLGHLVVFVALGCTASSSLTLPVWWLILANTCVCAADLRDRTRPSTRDGLDAGRTTVEAASEQARESRRVADQFGRETNVAAASAPHVENSPADETAAHLKS